jgi:type IV pilus assembly protein PilC
MPKYSYQVREGSGRSDVGILVASDLMEASRQLRKEGKTIVSLREDSQAARGVAKAAPQARELPMKKVRREDVIYFATQLAVMVDTGVTLSEALDAIADQTDHGGLKRMISDISEQVKSGTEFSQALEKYSQCFGKLFTSMMRASEASGTMGMMLQRVSDYMVQERDTVKRIKGAMIYPICMLSFCVIVVVALLVFVLPKFEKIYSSKGAALPLPTQMLLALSNGIRDHYIIILTVIIVSGTGLFLFLRTAGGKIFMDTVRIRLPIIGSMFRKAYIARSMRTMGTMVSTGVSMLDGLNITAEVAGNYHFQKIWLDLAEKVKEGSGLSEELLKCTLMPRSVSQMISAGERTGKLSQVMNRLADFCEEDLKTAVKSLTTLIEPAMIIFMGMLIGGIAMALLLPVFSISKVMTAH